MLLCVPKTHLVQVAPYKVSPRSLRLLGTQCRQRINVEAVELAVSMDVVDVVVSSQRLLT